MLMNFERPVGAVADVRELEYISALHQTGFLELRKEGSISATDVVHFLSSRYGIRVTEHEVRETIFKDFGGGGISSKDGENIDLVEILGMLLIPLLLKASQDYSSGADNASSRRVVDIEAPKEDVDRTRNRRSAEECNVDGDNRSEEEGDEKAKVPLQSSGDNPDEGDEGNGVRSNNETSKGMDEGRHLSDLDATVQVGNLNNKRTARGVRFSNEVNHHSHSYSSALQKENSGLARVDGDHYFFQVSSSLIPNAQSLRFSSISNADEVFVDDDSDLSDLDKKSNSASRSISFSDSSHIMRIETKDESKEMSPSEGRTEKSSNDKASLCQNSFDKRDFPNRWPSDSLM
mmetsp:Transcript_10470/g.19711  ORF Transcript_10470/g.19711 Transcript_10470/m.19711 type:complete len:347 (+) Transcript_10470:87-1127(+)